MLEVLLGEVVPAISLLYTGLIATFILTACMLWAFRGKMPQDQGRKFAVDGSLSKGKVRGVGLIFVLVFSVMVLLFMKPTVEICLFLFFIVLSMLTGFFDDASEKPWNEYKKGILDFIIAAGITATYIWQNGTAVKFAYLGITVELPVWLFAILSVILIWVSINVTNCTDGVDGLSASVSIITLMSFFLYTSMGTDFNYVTLFFVVSLLAYLLFNATPSLMLMGDAGSRAMGTIIAIAALKSGSPLMFIPFALVLILDGGLGLIKLSLKRFLKISIMKNTRTPLHDHYRKNKEWSNTQVVFRFVIIQIMISTLAFAIYSIIEAARFGL